MAYRPNCEICISTAPIEVIAPATITTGGTTSAPVDAQGADTISYWIDIGGIAGGAARLDVAAQWSADNLVWADQMTEAIAAGVAPQSVYDAQFPVVVAGLIHLTLPTFGRRYSRVIIASDAGTFTATVVTATLGS